MVKTRQTSSEHKQAQEQAHAMIIVKNPRGRNVALLVVAGVGAYALYRHRQKVDAAFRRAQQFVDDVRQPMPHYAVVVPESQEEHAAVDEAICMCFAQLGSPQEVDAAALAQQLTTCVADMLYPEFPWPPQYGDHESVPMFWRVIGFRIRSLIFNAQLQALCAGESVVWEDPPGPGPVIDDAEPEGGQLEDVDLPPLQEDDPLPDGAVRYNRTGPHGTYTIQVAPVGANLPTFTATTWAQGKYIVMGDHDFHQEDFPTFDHAAMAANAWVDAA